MGRKRNPVLPVFTRDILSSPRCRALSASAAGIYFFLLCRLNEPPTPGAYRLSDWEQHPNWQRSKTQQCLATADKYERLQYFASLLAKNDLPWRQKDILSGLQELYRYGIVTVEGDMLVQPRMYKDNGFDLPDLDCDGDPENTILDDPTSGSMASMEVVDNMDNNRMQKRVPKTARKSAEISTEKVQEKDEVIHAGAHSKEIEIENNINNNSTNNNIDSKKAKNAKFVPPTLGEVQAYCQEKAFTFDPVMFWNHYEANGWVQGKGKPIKSWKACCVTWQQREGEFTTPASKTPSAGAKMRPVASAAPRAGDPINATPASKGKYKKW